MKDYIDCKPVMLPVTGVVSIDHTLWLNAGGRMLHTHTSTPEVLQPQHLYLVSDEEIKIGDWVWDGRLNPQPPDWPIYQVEEDDDIPKEGSPDRKIESCTNKSLSLPLIPTSFVERWVNEQGKIDKVRVQVYEKGLCEHLGYIHPHVMGVTGEDRDKWTHPEGVVIILPIEDKTYSREEVNDILLEWEKVMPIKGIIIPWFDKNYPI